MMSFYRKPTENEILFAVEFFKLLSEDGKVIGLADYVRPMAQRLNYTFEDARNILNHVIDLGYLELESNYTLKLKKNPRETP